MSKPLDPADYIHMNARIDPITSCWEWTLKHDAHGYGVAQRKPFKGLAHRAAYKIFVGAIPCGLELDHLCRNHACVNPDHLEAVTHAENMRRGKHKSATHCKHGHPFDESNTYIHDGRRTCKTCNRIAVARYSKKNLVGTNLGETAIAKAGAQ